MNIAVCDDNREDAEKIRSCLLEHFERNAFAGDIHIFESGEALLANFSPGFFDAYFLDVYMGGLSGVDAARKIRKEDPFCALIFITSSPDHMADGFSLRAASYLVKPLDAEKMDRAFLQCRDIFLKNARYIEITFERQSFRIPLIKILYAEVLDKTVFFHTADQIYKAYMPMDEAERELGGNPFLRCHNSFIVNMNHVQKILEDDLLMQNGEKVPLRRKKRMEIKTAVNRFFSNRMFEEW